MLPSDVAIPPLSLPRGAVRRVRAGAARALRDRRGATALEFALVGGAFVALMIGVLEVGRYMIVREAVRVAAMDAVRVAILRGSANLNAGAAACRDLSGSLAGAVSGGPMLRADQLLVGMSGCATAGGLTSVTVTVSYPFAHAIPLRPAGTITLREEGTATIF